MTKVKVASYGSWHSSITPEKLAEGVSSILNMYVDHEDTYWVESRPRNKGYYTIVKCTRAGELQDITPSNFNVRTRVHEYGGGAFAVKDGVIYASNSSDQAIYKITPGQEPQKLTQGQKKIDSHWEGTRFADLKITSKGLYAIGETHRPQHPPENFIALIDTNSGEFKKIAHGNDFYSSPNISDDEKKIAWITWNQPHMPWQKSELWIADLLDDGTIGKPQQITGQQEEAVMQPQWGPEGQLYFVSDRDSGWWNIHRFHHNTIENICPMQGEVGDPLWIFGKYNYGFLNGKIISTLNTAGAIKIVLIDPATKSWQEIPRNSTTKQLVNTGKNFVRFLEGTPDKEEDLIEITLDPGINCRTIYSKPRLFDKEEISFPEHFSYPSGERTAHAFLYLPKNSLYKAPEGEKPPLVVMIHGGPTAQARSSFQPAKQFWTSRGFAVLDVDYGGSTGYGRNYRELLDHNWGIVDVEDCINGAQWLVKRGMVDGKRLAIRGSSAGGFTTLATIAASSLFGAAASYYGVADITSMIHDTHKFEASYMDQLVGKYSDTKDLWIQRSPIHSVDKIETPLIIFQGEEDPVVPKEQSIMIYEALKKRGVPVEMHLYPGEEHGFRIATNVAHSLNAEVNFYLKSWKQHP